MLIYMIHEKGSCFQQVRTIKTKKYFAMQIKEDEKNKHFHQSDCKIIRLQSMICIKHNYIQMHTLKMNIKSVFILQ